MRESLAGVATKIARYWSMAVQRLSAVEKDLFRRVQSKVMFSECGGVAVAK